MLAEKVNFPVKLMVRLLEVSRSGFYACLTKGAPVNDWEDVRVAVKRIREVPDRHFRARFVKCFMPDEYADVTLYRARKCMHELGIQGYTSYKSKRTTIPDKNAKPRPDLVHRDFTSPIPTYKLVGDITYLRTGQGWLYLSTVIDLNTQMVVGWSLLERMTADIVVSAFESAKTRGYVAEARFFTQTMPQKTLSRNV